MTNFFMPPRDRRATNRARRPSPERKRAQSVSRFASPSLDSHDAHTGHSPTWPILQHKVNPAAGAAQARSSQMKFFSKRRPAGVANGAGEVRIDVNGGYSPNEVTTAAGVPTRIVFHRHDSSPCSEQVVFPQFGVRVDLPQHKDVAVELPAAEPGEYEFECGMGMLHGRLVAR